MELAFVWIENDNVLQHAQLNFSSKFNFHSVYSEKPKSIDITVDKNKNSIPDLYGNRVKELTALVGSNGVGKTTILEAITRLLSNSLIVNDRFVACFYDSENSALHSFHNLFTVHEKGKIDDHWIVRVVSVDKQLIVHQPRSIEVGFDRNGYVNHYQLTNLENSKVIYYSPAFDLRNYPEGVKNSRNYIDISTNYLVFNDSANKDDSEDLDQIERHRLKNTKRQFEFVQDKRFDLTEIQLPDSIQVRFNKVNPFERELSISNRAIFNKLHDQGTKSFKGRSVNRSDDVDKRSSRLEETRERVKLWFLVNLVDNYFANLAIVGDLKFDLSIDIDVINTGTFLSTVKQFFEQQDWIPVSEFDFGAFIDFTLNLFDESSDLNRDLNENASYFYVKIERALEVYQWDVRLVQAYSKAIDRRDRNPTNFLDLNWRDMSTGERAFLDLFSRIFFAYREMIREISGYYFNASPEAFFYGRVQAPQFLYLLLDEPELGFHPKWQRKFIATLVEYLNVLGDIRIQVILTSHSPFVLSDIPRQHVIFLTREPNKKAEVSSLTSHDQTFAANINDLFADTFFMGQGLAGDFATNFIKKLVADLTLAQKNGTTIEESISLKNRIEIIGEPIIKSRLEDLYEELLIIDDIDQQIADAEETLKRLRAQKGNK